MSYDEQLAAHVRALLKGQRALVEKNMFGGLAYMSQGKMFAGILKHNLVVRVGPKANDQALKEPHTRSLSDIAVRDEAKEVRPDARPQARKNRRRIRWNTLRIFSGRERRRWSWIVRRSRAVSVGQAPRPMDFTGRPMKGYLYAGPDGTKSAAQLRTWLTRGLEFVSGLTVAKPMVRRQRG
jgi:hypothetical protein